MLLSLGRYVLFGMVVGLLVAAGGVLALAPPGGAAAQPQPTMVLSPSSGPCDATVEVRGQDFPPDTTIELALAAPGTPTKLDDVASVVTDANGYFALRMPLGFLGCEAAVLNGESGPGPREVRVVADFKRPLQDDEPPPVVSVSYFYTTRSVAEPGPILIVTPAAGPCDATVEVTGQGFPRGGEVALYLSRPHSEGAIGALGTAAAAAGGGFSTLVSLGPLGCEAAALDTQASAPGEPKELGICGDIAGTPFPPGLSCTRYVYTTTHVSTGVTPEGLPRAGYGPDQSRGRDMRFLGLVLGLAAGGALLVAVALAWRRNAG